MQPRRHLEALQVLTPGVSTTPPHKCGGNSACGVPGHPQPWHASGQLGQYVRHPWPWLQAVVALRHHDNCL